MISWSATPFGNYWGNQESKDFDEEVQPVRGRSTWVKFVVSGFVTIAGLSGCGGGDAEDGGDAADTSNTAATTESGKAAPPIPTKPEPGFDVPPGMPSKEPGKIE